MAFHEDRSRVRTGNADQNLAVVRMAVNMLKQETTAKVGIKAKRKKAGSMNTCSRSSLPKMRLPCF